MEGATPVEQRRWISNQLMFWESDKWDQAYLGFGTLSGTEQVTCMIGWLMNSYPVPRELLEERKRRVRA
jgi:hypothetical protein